MRPIFEYTGFMTRFADRGAAARRFSVTQWGSNRRPRAAAGYSKKMFLGCRPFIWSKLIMVLGEGWAEN